MDSELFEVAVKHWAFLFCSIVECVPCWKYGANSLRHVPPITGSESTYVNPKRGHAPEIEKPELLYLFN